MDASTNTATYSYSCRIQTFTLFMYIDVKCLCLQAEIHFPLVVSHSHITVDLYHGSFLEISVLVPDHTLVCLKVYQTSQKSFPLRKKTIALLTVPYVGVY